MSTEVYKKTHRPQMMTEEKAGKPHQGVYIPKNPSTLARLNARTLNPPKRKCKIIAYTPMLISAQVSLGSHCQ